MTTPGWPATAEINEIFTEEIEAVGGKVTDIFDDGARTFLRAILEGEREVQPGDRVQGGVALRGTSEDISVHPYVFRQVCKNGAIRAHAIESREVPRCEFPADLGQEAAYVVRETIRACCREEVFEAGAAEMRRARGLSDTDPTGIDLILWMIPLVARLAQDVDSQPIVAAILDRIFQERDRSRFGLMNAVTSVARDTPDPELRWRLEELGGGIAVAVNKPKFGPMRARAEMLVGA
jgi:hypothetical protein